MYSKVIIGGLNFEKGISVVLAALLVASALIFPLVSALAVNSVTWDGYPEWKDNYRVRGYVEIFSYTGNIPTAIIVGQTNCGNSIETRKTGIGFARSDYQICDISGSLPLLSYWNAYCIQDGN